MSDRKSETMPADGSQPPSNTVANIQPTVAAPKRLPGWRFWAVVAIQSALIVAVPFKSALTYSTGQTVTLQTAPVDPYDFMRGYSQTLRFNISDMTMLRALPGGDAVFSEGWDGQPKTFYLTLEDIPLGETAIDSAEQITRAVGEAGGESAAPNAWEPVAVSLQKPELREENQVVLKGYTNTYSVRYGLETYYMPEAQRNDINNRIGELRGSPESYVVDVQVDKQGNSVLRSLWLKGEEYRF